MKFIKEVRALAKRYGFVEERMNWHLVFRHKRTGRIVSTSRTPNCPFALRKVERDFRRVDEQK